MPLLGPVGDVVLNPSGWAPTMGTPSLKSNTEGTASKSKLMLVSPRSRVTIASRSERVTETASDSGFINSVIT